MRKAPERARRWKRTAILALLLLAGGAIVNVAVAWGCAGRIQITEWGVGGFITPRFNNSELDPELPVRSPFPSEHALATHAVRPAYRTAAVTVFHWRHRFPGRGPYPATLHMEAGWPVKAFAGTAKFSPYGGVPGVPGELDGTEKYSHFGPFAVTGAIRLERSSARQLRDYQQVVLLPRRHIWPGFVINTSFYALLLWPLLWLLFFAPFAARRMLRRRRGLCETCAYPIGVSPVCTECGAAVRRS